MQKKSAVLHFIDEERAKGTSDKEIRHQLLDAGWQMDIIRHTMDGAAPKPEHQPKAKQIESSVTPAQRVRTLLRKPLVVVGLFVLLALLALFV